MAKRHRCLRCPGQHGSGLAHQFRQQLIVPKRISAVVDRELAEPDLESEVLAAPLLIPVHLVVSRRHSFKLPRP